MSQLKLLITNLTKTGNQVREVKCPPHVNLYQWNASETSNAL